MLPRPFADPKDCIAVRSRIPELDGIRGIAVLAVIIHHSVANYTPVATWEKVVCQTVGIGWSGVDLFFVLSGFLISGILIDTRESPRYFSAFYARRILRIFPLYFAYLAGFFFIVKPFAWVFPFPEVAKWSLLPATEQLWYWSYLSNWRSGLGHDISFLTHFWSLAIEEQFYMIWPLVVFFAPRRALLRICIGIIVSALVMRSGLEYALAPAPAEMIYRFTPFRIDSLAFGAIAAMVSRSASLRDRIYPHLDRALFLSACLLLVVLVKTTNAYHPLMRTVGYSMLGLTYSIFLLCCVSRMGTNDWRCRLARYPVLHSFGKYSYAMYVLHYPLCWFVDRVGMKVLSPHLGHGLLTMFTVTGIGLAATYGLSLVSWNLFEKHFIKLKDHFLPEGTAARVRV